MRMPINFFIIILCLLEFKVLAPTPVYAQYCDPGLTERINHPQAYEHRGDRCEGIYIQPVGGTILVIASFTRLYEDFDLNSDSTFVEWTNIDAGRVNLRAYGLKRRLYYRMDTVRPEGDTLYSWPTNILRALKLTKKDIGVVGWTKHREGEFESEIFLPLRISQEMQQPPSDDYRLLLLPGVELEEVYLSIASVADDGSLDFVSDEEALAYGYYPAERSIEIPITDLETEGIYYLEISATKSGGGSATLEKYFYHKEK